jgi:hypothetical protein
MRIERRERTDSLCRSFYWSFEYEPGGALSAGRSRQWQIYFSIPWRIIASQNIDAHVQAKQFMTARTFVTVAALC